MGLYTHGGRAWFEELASGRAASFGEIADRVGVTDRYVSRIVDLAFLAPDDVEAILAGEQRPDATVKSLTVDGSVPVVWNEQRRGQSHRTSDDPLQDSEPLSLTPGAVRTNA